MIAVGEPTFRGKGSKFLPGYGGAGVTISSWGKADELLRILVREDISEEPGHYRAQVYLDEATAQQLYAALGRLLGQ